MAMTAGCMARAWASARPVSKPSLAAAQSTATRRSRLLRLPKTTRGEPSRSCRCRAIRSVESRSSHRLRILCELETLLHTFPLHDPCSGMTTTVARQVHCPARRADVVESRRWKIRRGRCKHPARCAGGGLIVRLRAQQKPQRVSSCCCERKTARGHMLDAARANLGDHHAERAAAQRFFHRPEHIAHAWGRNRDQVFRSNAGLVEARSVKLPFSPSER